mmetsp:Transcript_47805/g.84714  ORF Transcript_47805/g.84714 Transcript_47805/m.84714 type:complete len:470 (+) Transcript_47805:1-1410(+)
MASVARIRGFCHGCSREVLAEEVEEEEYSCPLCHEVGIVECPLEGFERWAGEWHADYDDGSASRFDITENGLLRRMNLDEEAWETRELTVQLECAASDAAARPEAQQMQPFMLRARGHWLEVPPLGVITEYFRLEADGSLHIRCACGDQVLYGRAVRCDAENADATMQARRDDIEADAMMQDEGIPVFVPLNFMDLPNALQHAMSALSTANPADLGVAVTDFMQGFSEGMQQAGTAPENAPENDARRVQQNFMAAVESGFRRLANNNTSMSPGQRQALEQQGANVSQMLANFVSTPLPVPADFMNPQAGRREQNRLAVPEALARRWIEEHAIAEPPRGRSTKATAGVQEEVTPSSSSTCEKGEHDTEEGWMCPICYLGVEDTEGLVLLCEGDGEAGENGHVFHRECATNWLCRQNSCPICRRSPVVPMPEGTATAGARNMDGTFNVPMVFSVGPVTQMQGMQPPQAPPR